MTERTTTARPAESATADIVDELRAVSLASYQMPSRPDGPNADELAVLDRDVRWQAAAEIEQLRRAMTIAWRPMETAPKDDKPVLLYCPRLSGHAAKDIVVGVWRFDANRRTFGYWVSDVCHLDQGFAETGPWLEYVELRPQKWAPLAAPSDVKS
jgi:hypothetical protein